MSFTRSTRDLSGRVIAAFDLIGSRFRQSNHAFRRSKGTSVSTIVVLCVIGILTVGVLFKTYHKSDEYLGFFDYEDNGEYETESSSYGLDAESEGLGVAIPDETRKAFNDALELVKKYSPDGELDTTKGDDCDIGDIRISDTSQFHKLTKESLEKCLNVPDETVKKLNKLHEDFKGAIRKSILPSFDVLEAQGNPAFKGDGIVIVGGGRFSVFALPAIKAIRENSGVKTKNTIPIEIIIPPHDKGDRGFCENVLPKVDPSGLTKCVFLDEILSPETLSHIEGYQIKAVALFVSKFERVLMLDADNYVVNSLDEYFTHQKFKEKGLILWPDYWRRLHHPKMYDIVNLGVSTKSQRYSIDNATPDFVYKKDAKETPFHDFFDALPDGSTESGQVLIDKKKHLDSLLMTLYYNFNGKSYFYPLLGQGFAGEGDKDTFALGCRVMHGPEAYYPVKTPVDTLGHWADKDEIRIPDEDLEKSIDGKQFRGTAMIQHDFTDDVRFSSLAREVIGNAIRDRFHSFCDEWARNHEGKLSKDQKERREQCDKSDEVKKAFRDKESPSYGLKDYLSFFHFTKVSFIHSHLPKYDPWEWSHTGDMMFNGAKALKNHKDEPEYSPMHAGHYRMYDSKISQLTSYDLELANWSAFKDYLCDIKDGYKNFGYLVQVLEETEFPHQSNENMCNYIRERVEYLQSNTWTDTDI